MAGVKGRSGSGGARPGAGRKPTKKKEPEKQIVPVPSDDKDMLTLLQDIALGRIEVAPIQLRAAIAAVQYTHPKVGEGGKKERKQEAAKNSAGKFAPAAPPKLSVVGGKGS
jgi:phage terminase small subunit